MSRSVEQFRSVGGQAWLVRTINFHRVTDLFVNSKVHRAPLVSVCQWVYYVLYTPATLEDVAVGVQLLTLFNTLYILQKATLSHLQYVVGNKHWTVSKLWSTIHMYSSLQCTDSGQSLDVFTFLTFAVRMKLLNVIKIWTIRL